MSEPNKKQKTDENETDEDETDETDDVNRPDRLSSLPDDVLRAWLIPNFGFKDYANVGAAAQFFQEKFIKSQPPLYVPEDCATLNEAVERVHGDPRITTIVVGKGEYKNDGYVLEIPSAMNIVGDPRVPRDGIVIRCDIEINKGITGNCHLQHLTLRQAKGSGVLGKSSFTMEDVLVEQCVYGVRAEGTGVVCRCADVEVRKCANSAVVAVNGASITLMGPKTKVHLNCTSTDGMIDQYGLQVFGASSTIQLVSPLTKEIVSVDNVGGRDWGVQRWSDANINQIKTIPKFELACRLEQEAAIASRIDAFSNLIKASASLTVNVPSGYNLKECVKAVHLVNLDKIFTAGRTITIMLEEGRHYIHGDYLGIFSTMNIVGDPEVSRDKIVINGGIQFDKGIGMCHLQHLTLRHPRVHSRSGVTGLSSFTMNDVVVEWCGYSGVVASGTGVVARCTNVEVRQCGASGVGAANGASITLIGKTTVHNNCRYGNHGEYGLKVSGASSTIQLVAPLTKEIVSVDNGGGGEWGARHGANIDNIKNIGTPSSGETKETKSLHYVLRF
jgi:hypothetical protein